MMDSLSDDDDVLDEPYTPFNDPDFLFDTAREREVFDD